VPNRMSLHVHVTKHMCTCRQVAVTQLALNHYTPTSRSSSCMRPERASSAACKHRFNLASGLVEWGTILPVRMPLSLLLAQVLFALCR